MTSTTTATSSRPAAAHLPRAALLIGTCLGLAALSLLAPSTPSYDPFAWIVWGRELVDHSQTFGMAGGPSWKPLPVLFTTVFAFAGGAAPGLWLLVARASALLALAGAWRLGARLAGVWAGALAAVALLLTDAFVSLAARGASEPLLIACVLWAIELHLAGRRGSAFALGVGAALIRPEAWPFLGLYALWRWRETGSRERLTLLGGLALVPLLWIGVPGLAGEPLAASGHAAAYDGHTGANPGWTALRRGLELAVAPVWVLAGAALVLRRGDRVVRLLALGATAWLALVVAMTIAGYPGLARFMLPAAAVACVLAGAGFVWLVERAKRGLQAGVLAAVLLLACATLASERAGTLVDQVREGTQAARWQQELSHAIAALGGRAGVLRCAGPDGVIATNHTAQTALAWKLRLELDRVAPAVAHRGIAFRGPQSTALGEPPPLALSRPYSGRLLAHVGVWRVVALGPYHAPPPPGCGKVA
jgi:hypothetical protein